MFSGSKNNVKINLITLGIRYSYLIIDYSIKFKKNSFKPEVISTLIM